MRQVREVLRLKHACRMSARQIGEIQGIGRTTVGDYLRRLEVAGVSWPLPDGLGEDELERLLFPPPGPRNRVVPDWTQVHAELRRPGVTLRLLWEEYRGEHPDGYGLSRFSQLYQQWRGRLSPSMRQNHVAGEM